MRCKKKVLTLLVVRGGSGCATGVTGFSRDVYRLSTNSTDLGPSFYLVPDVVKNCEHVSMAISHMAYNLSVAMSPGALFPNMLPLKGGLR